MHQSAIPGNWHYFIARKTKEVETMIDLAKSTGFGSRDRGLVVKFLSILLFAAFVTGLANTSYARTTRSSSGPMASGSMPVTGREYW
jgi:hypothetical protein